MLNCLLAVTTVIGVGEEEKRGSRACGVWSWRRGEELVESAIAREPVVLSMRFATEKCSDRRAKQ